MPEHGLGTEVAGLLWAVGELTSRGLLSASGHGNVSMRLPAQDEIVYSATSDLRRISAADFARLTVAGQVSSGQLTELAAGGARMHIAVYGLRPDVNCVIHTHAPFATAFAVARRNIRCWAEPLSIFGMADGIPLSEYAPRGSAEAIAAIERVSAGTVRGVLLANHGLLAYGATAAEAVHVLTLIEEAAQLGVYAAALGGPLTIPAGPR